MRQFLLPVSMLLMAPVFVVSAGAAEIEPAQLDFFEKKIRPVLAKNCYMCHSAEAKTRMGGLSLDTKQGMRNGGQRGHAVVPGDVDAGVLMAALRHEGKLKMPPMGKLPAGVIEDFASWIRMGAPDPREVNISRTQSTIDVEKGRGYWAFQAPEKAGFPAVRGAAWPRGAIDQFILAKIEEKGLRPVGDVSREALIRRASYDLTGLPPTPAEIAAFVADDDERAFHKVVDRLLASERFGERWGRHWLDVARYAETIGRTRNLPFPVAWKYRDYVIDAFNADKPYDEFVREQIAGDLLPYRNRSERNEQQIATGFLALGAHDLNEPDRKLFPMDVADEMINVTTRSMLALSVGCARCHDHKFDPIPTKDYYSMAGIFRSSELRDGLRLRPRFNSGYFRIQKMVTLDGVPDYSGEEAAELRAKRERLWQELLVAEEARDRAKTRKLARELGDMPVPENLAMGVVEAEQAVDCQVNVGGDPHMLGDETKRGFVQVLFSKDRALPQIGENESGRLQLAAWLTDRENPMTARVMVNRVWSHLFGRGIVKTVDNFGKMGSPPTHPELLDYLAVRFMEQGWSVKNLIREIVLSRTYRLSTDFDAANFEIEPDNTLLWRANRRRLEVEALRDSLLLISGEMSAERPAASPVHDFSRNQLINTGNKQVERWEVEETYRSVYVPVIRNQVNRFFETFDFPEPSETHGARDVTTVATQALFLMNSDFVQAHAQTAAERLIAGEKSDAERVRRAFRQVLSREPTEAEVEKSLAFIASTAEALRSEEQPRRRQSRVKAEENVEDWLFAAVTALLRRQPTASEMTDAMDYMSEQQPDAEKNVRDVKRFFVNNEGNLRRRQIGEFVELLLGRPATPRDFDEIAAFLEDARRQARRRGAPMVRGPQEAWARLYHALFSSAEFRYRG